MWMANSKPQDNADTVMYESDRHSIPTATGGAHTPVDPDVDDAAAEPASVFMVATCSVFAVATCSVSAVATC